MGRIYSGNLIAYKDAIQRLQEDHDVGVLEESFRYRDEIRNREVCGEALRITTRSGFVLVAKSFEQRDPDVRINEQTAWLRKIHSDLKNWK